MSNDAKAPPFRQESDNEEARTYAYNQERMLELQERTLELQGRVAQAMDDLLKNQQSMAVLATKLDANLNMLAGTMKQQTDAMNDQTKVTSGMVDKVIQVPITIVIVSVASAFFYFKYIDEWLWIGICAVASFKYLGDSITSVVKLFGMGRQGNDPGEKK